MPGNGFQERETVGQSDTLTEIQCNEMIDLSKYNGVAADHHTQNVKFTNFIVAGLSNQSCAVLLVNKHSPAGYMG